MAELRPQVEEVGKLPQPLREATREVRPAKDAHGKPRGESFIEHEGALYLQMDGGNYRRRQTAGPGEPAR